eukprot:Sro1306_g261250.2  (946) ;mRNA; r:15200-18037
MDEKTPMPAVYIGGVLQTNNTAAALLSAVCQVTPAELRPADVCDDIVDAVGADEDPEAGAKAEEELVEEIATELGETPEDVKGENASELEDKLEEEEIKEGQGDAEDMEKLAENLGTQDETELESGGDLSKVDEETIEVEEKALEKEEAKDANIEVEEPKSVQPIVEVWTTPLLDWDMASLTEDGPNVKLFEMLKSVVTSFGSDIDFRPQPYLFSQAEICTVDEKGNQLSDDDAAKCADDNCANNHRYCGFGPDDWKVTGKSMVEESVRRLCIWEDYGRGGAGSGATSYFSYLKKFHSHKCQQADDMNICVTEIYKFVNIEATNVDACMAGSGGLDVDGENSILAPLLKLQKATFFFHHLNPMNLPIILVDGQPLEGGADVSAADLVNAVCPKFTSDPKPALCQEGALAALIPGSEEEAATEEPPTESETPADDEETKATKSPAPSAAPSYSPSSAPSAAPSTPVSEGSEATEEPPVESEATETPPTEETETETTEMPPTEETETEATETPPTEATESEATETPPTEGAPDVLTPGTPQMPWGMSSAITTEPPPLDKAGEETFNTPVTLDKSKRGDDSNFDIKAFDSTLSNLGMLNTCGVDTNAVYNKVMSLAAGNMKQELEKIKIDLPMLMSQTCEKDMGVDVLHAMDQFHGCAKFNLQSLIENLPSAAFGVAMRCANAYSKITPEEEAKGFIPEDCIRAIENDSSLGRATFALYLYPDHACPCFETLGENIPECTADVWPIPINGALVKVQTCLVGQYCQSIDALCEKHLDTLNKCLPAHDTSNSKITCGECQAAFYDNVPKILSAAPLPDACVRMAEGSKFFGSHVMERFDTYRKKCGTNLELWEGHTPMAELKNFVMQGVKEIDYKSNQFIEGAVVGFAAGIVFTIAFIIVRWILICVCSCLSRWFCCCCKGKKKSQRPRAKDYATVETETDEIPEPEYRD